MGDSAVRNAVVLTGDVHRHWAAEIKEKYGQPDSKGVGVELVTTSITSERDELSADYRVLPSVTKPGAPPSAPRPASASKTGYRH